MKKSLTLLCLVFICQLSWGQTCSNNVKHHIDKLDYSQNYYYINPLKIKNKKNQLLTIDIMEMSGDYVLQLRVAGTKSKFIRKMEEEMIFVFNDTLRLQPVNRLPTNRNGETGTMLLKEGNSKFTNSIEISMMNDYYNHFKNYNLNIIRVYTTADYADFKLSHLESEQLKNSFNCLIETVLKNRKY